MDSPFLSNHVLEPMKGKNVLNLIMTNKDDLISNIKQEANKCLSDHNNLCVKTTFTPKLQKKGAVSQAYYKFNLNRYNLKEAYDN